MSDFSIRVSGLGKKYRIPHAEKANYQMLRDSLTSVLGAPFRHMQQLVNVRSTAPRRQKPAKKDDFWALQDVSFDVRQGHVAESPLSDYDTHDG